MVKTKIELKFSFLAVLSVILCTDTEGTALQCLLACALHEAGHITAMLFSGNPPEKIVFAGGGIKLKGKNENPAVIIGGCFVNFILFGIFYFLSSNYSFKLFGIINLLTGVFNLIPVCPLDGYHLLEIVLIKLISPEKIGKVLKITEITACVLSAPFILIFFFRGSVNFSLVIFLFYLFVVDIIENL